MIPTLDLENQVQDHVTFTLVNIMPNSRVDKVWKICKLKNIWDIEIKTLFFSKRNTEYTKSDTKNADISFSPWFIVIQNSIEELLCLELWSNKTYTSTKSKYPISYQSK